ncbi:hypothetical protein [Actinoplanes derwentensis]|uniref:hypothetical protein n=1 Tax=Actinoplanes derwentensis TaxID=113562 RepID=UPI000AECEE7E|nr:hypothetical protein [Actinoplanes derwentensis]GID88466.1 hypothetical protein Ade03nite_73900 [Actinoplanes derwentensis]
MRRTRQAEATETRRYWVKSVRLRRAKPIDSYSLPRTGIAAGELRGLPEFAALRAEVGHAIRDRVTV